MTSLTEIRIPPAHHILLDLSSGAQLHMRMWGEEHRWIFKYNYREVENHEISLINEECLTVNYVCGRVTDTVVLSMNVIFPKRLGQQFFVGVDISPGAKTYFEFTYKLEGNGFRLAEGQIGARPKQHFNEGSGLVKLVDLPFPVPNRI